MTITKALKVLKSWLQVAYQNADGTDEASSELYEALQVVFRHIKSQDEEIKRLGRLGASVTRKLVKARTESMTELADKLQDRWREQGGYLYPSDIGAVLNDLLGEVSRK